MTFELLDDQLASVALQEALAFIDAYDISAPAAIVNENAHVVPIAPAPAAVVSFGPVILPQQTSPKVRTQRKSGTDAVQTKPTRVRNRSRGDQKAELERLRHDVKMLEAKLARLKGTSEYPPPYSSPGSTSTTSVSNSSEDESLDAQQVTSVEDTLVSMWKAVALRQFQRRNHSEMTNRKLKLVLAKQLKLAKTLEGLYSRRTTQNVSPNTPVRLAGDTLTLCDDGRTWNSCTTRVLRSRIMARSNGLDVQTPCRLCY